MNVKNFFKLCLFIAPLHVYAQDNDALFKGVTEQAHSYSCGAAALSTLITGIVENSHVSEEDIANAVTPSDKELGYTAIELANAAKKLGHTARWREVEPSQLAALKQPVILLIGKNSDTPHYVVFEGIENGNVFLADPMRGKVHLAYDKLVKEGINNEYKSWAVMAIKASDNKPKDSTLYLSADKYDSHFTIEKSAIITLTTITRNNQLIVNYDFFTELGSARNDNLSRQTRNFSHRLGVRYGITANTEIGGTIIYGDNRESINAQNIPIITNSSNRIYEIYANHRFSLDNEGRNGINLGASASFSEQNSIWGGGVNLTAYTNTSFAQFLAGGSINKQVSSNNLVNNGLPDFQFSGFVSANKPIGDRYNASLSFAINNDFNRYLPVSEFNRSYSVSTGLTYIINSAFQVTPSLGYSFGNNSGGDSFTFGASLVYTGGW